MKHIQSKLHTRICSYLLLLALVIPGCKKEDTLEPSNQDDNYLVNYDNPNDPVDHAIYQFYTSTKIPCFYNDTVVLKKADGTTDAPQNYVLLSLSYSPFEYFRINRTLPKNRQPIPAVLDLLKTDVVPRIPQGIFIPSFLFVDSFWTEGPRGGVVSADGFDSFHGFNTVAIKLRDINTMNAEEKKVYAASILAGIAAKKLMANPAQNARLQETFYRITRDITQPLINTDIYNTLLLDPLFPTGVPDPETLGFFHYVILIVQFDDLKFEFTIAPREEDDLRMFLTAAFTYTTQEFNQKYNSYPALPAKFNALKSILREAGFPLPD